MICEFTSARILAHLAGHRDAEARGGRAGQLRGGAGVKQ
jgi:hypothetical protein